MPSILIAGASGYLGSVISHFFAKKGYEVTALGRFSSEKSRDNQQNKQNIIIGDITDENLIQSLKIKQFDYALHLISLDNKYSEGDFNYVSKVNVISTWNLLNTLTKSGLKKFIYFSTVQVYGDLENYVTEDSYRNPKNVYGLTHALSEDISNFFNQKNTQCINLRLANGYGSPHNQNASCWDLVVNNICKDAFKKKRINLLSDGTPLKDFIHVKDICQAVELILLLKNQNKIESTYNICSGNTISIMSVAKIVQDIYFKRYKKRITIKSKPKDKYKSEPNPFKISNEKIKNYGFNQLIKLEAGVNEIFDYLENYYAK